MFAAVTWHPFVWVLGSLVGYALFMSANPLRDRFSDSFGILWEAGARHLWVVVAFFSLCGHGLEVSRLWEERDRAVPGFSANWQGAEISEKRGEMAVNTVRRLADVFSSVVTGTGGSLASDARTRVAGMIGGLLGSAVWVFFQFYVIVFLYLRLKRPERAPKLGNLLNLAGRRFGRWLPWMILCWLIWTVPVVFALPEGRVRTAFQVAGATLILAFAFTQTDLLEGEFTVKEAVQRNFRLWRTAWWRIFWFLAVAASNLLILEMADAMMRGSMDPWSVPALVWRVVIVGIRSFVLVWLLGAWVGVYHERNRARLGFS